MALFKRKGATPIRSTLSPATVEAMNRSSALIRQVEELVTELESRLEHGPGSGPGRGPDRRQAERRHIGLAGPSGTERRAGDDRRKS